MSDKKHSYELWRVRVDRSQAKPKAIKEQLLNTVTLTEEHAEILNRGRIESSAASDNIVEYYYPVENPKNKK